MRVLRSPAFLCCVVCAFPCAVSLCVRRVSQVAAQCRLRGIAYGLLLPQQDSKQTLLQHNFSSRAVSDAQRQQCECLRRSIGPSAADVG